MKVINSTNQNYQSYRCDVFVYSGASKNVLKYLLDLDAKDWVEKTLQCHKCNKVFKTPTTLKRHLQKIHPDGGEPALPPDTVSADKLDGRYGMKR